MSFGLEYDTQSQFDAISDVDVAPVAGLAYAAAAGCSMTRQSEVDTKRATERP